MRIVKDTATISNAELANNYWKQVVRIDDTIEITNDWRPVDWGKIKYDECHKPTSDYRHCQATWDICFKCQIGMEIGFATALKSLSSLIGEAR